MVDSLSLFGKCGAAWSVACSSVLQRNPACTYSRFLSPLPVHCPLANENTLQRAATHHIDYSPLSFASPLLFGKRAPTQML